MDQGHMKWSWRQGNKWINQMLSLLIWKWNKYIEHTNALLDEQILREASIKDLSLACQHANIC